MGKRGGRKSNGRDGDNEFYLGRRDDWVYPCVDELSRRDIKLIGRKLDQFWDKLPRARKEVWENG
jgi:hypothetical protein